MWPTSPDSMDSMTKHAPLRTTISHSALPGCNTMPSPGTSRKDAVACPWKQLEHTALGCTVLVALIECNMSACDQQL